MRYLVLSDIHANLDALEAVFAAAPAHDAILALGDLVGYGAEPNAVVERVRALPALTVIRGNHDKVGAGVEDVTAFNHLARQAIEWTAATLTAENRQWLASLPAGPKQIDALVEICHGAPFDEDVYLFDDLDARRAVASTTRPVCLFGHTHVPAVYQQNSLFRALDVPRGGFHLTLAPETTYVVNCGAVGQPRDADPRAAFGLLDTDARTLDCLRVPYDVRAAQARILAAGLPDVLAHRLAVGR